MLKLKECSIRIAPAMIFPYLTSDCDVNYFTLLKNNGAFRLIFDYLSEKTRIKHYWKGLSNTLADLTYLLNLKNSKLRS